MNLQLSGETCDCPNGIVIRGRETREGQVKRARDRRLEREHCKVYRDNTESDIYNSCTHGLQDMLGMNVKSLLYVSTQTSSLSSS